MKTVIAKVKKNKTYKVLRTSIKEVDKQLDSVYNLEEINNMLSFKKKLFKINKKKTVKDKIEKALVILIESTGYYERLITIRGTMNSLRREADTLNRKAKNLAQNADNFSTFKRDDKSAITTVLTHPFASVLEKINHEIDTLDKYLDYLDKVQYNMKAVINCLKGDKGVGYGSR